MNASGLGLRDSTLPREETCIDPKDGRSIVRRGEALFPPRKVWMKTFGCQMNHHDSERILSHLGRLNFTPTDDRHEADLLLFNSCAVRDLSNRKFYSQLGATRELKKRRPGVIVGVGGCVSQVESKRLLARYGHLDFAFGTDVIDCINDFVYRAYAGESRFAVTSWDRSENFSIRTQITHNSPRAYVNIIKGCNKYCSYCIVPYTRGKERSRRKSEVVADIRRLVEYQGIQEVTLLGQNVNSFGHDNGELFADLLMELDEIEGLELIRYTTSHPYDVSDELIAVHGQAKKLSRHLHLPVQSGSDSVLARMSREYTKEHYLELLAKLRQSNPRIVISSDIIVGFVNETEEEFGATLELLSRAKFDFIYSYVYSKRAKTRAAKMADKLSDQVRRQRLHTLQQRQLDIQGRLRSDLVGRRFTILVDSSGRQRGVKKWKGRTNCNRIVHFLPPREGDFQWRWVDVEVTSVTALSCQGTCLLDHGKNIPAGVRRY